MQANERETYSESSEHRPTWDAISSRSKRPNSRTTHVRQDGVSKESARIPASFDECEGAMIKDTAMEGAASRCCFKELVSFDPKVSARVSFTIA